MEEDGDPKMRMKDILQFHSILLEEEVVVKVKEEAVVV